MNPLKKGGYVYYAHRCDIQKAVVLIERILHPEQKCSFSLSQVFSVGHVYTSKMQSLE